ncbi:MAG: 1-acyl-sn-glycerol-3-phosphate acyltransferase [Hyphomicrobiales bacterium]|nr:1-acyl-sn-glycerol-3-phosphate acyltransferase [Hyphomicrobiales bacterium]
MLFLRSVLFNLAFYILLIGLMILGLPMMLKGRQGIFLLLRAWARGTIFLLKHICNITMEFRHAERIPKGALLIASKHQSFLETFTMPLFFDDFTFVLKKQLEYIPVFGWYLRVAEQIAIDRGDGKSALRQVIAKASQAFAEGRQMFIFPEGTRRPVGAPPAFKPGASLIYARTGVRCLPVAINTGLFWPRRKFLRYPGNVVIEFLPVIEPGLDSAAFSKELQGLVETASDRLAKEALAQNPDRAHLLHNA